VSDAISTGPKPVSASGTLLLIPTNLSTPFSPAQILPQHVIATTLRLDHFIAENAKTARAFLKAIGVTRPLAEIQIAELDKHADSAAFAAHLEALIAPLLSGHDVGLVSEAGAPAVADPGANIVAAAHRAGVHVRPLVGASSILLALMASGLNGQSFAFHGYLPQEKTARTRALQTLERESATRRMTQMFIETPYRNQLLFADMVATLSPKTQLCIATDLTGEQESVAMKTVSAWRANPPALPKLPTMFLFLAA
jgi:16S rRNA (cytidine1402-2'-O)-methyltransferase